MALINKPTTDEEKIQFLKDSYPGYVASKAEAIVAGEGAHPSFDEYFNSLEKQVGRSFYVGLAKKLGQLINFSNQPGVKSNQGLLQQELSREKEDVLAGFDILKKYAGMENFLSDEGKQFFNALVEKAQSLYGEDIGVSKIEDAATGQADLVGMVTGETPTTIEQIEGVDYAAPKAPSVYNKYSPEAQALVEKVLKTDSTTDLAAYDWWKNSPVKGEAWDMLQEVTSSAAGMAEFVVNTGLTNLQDYSWWKTSPFKQDAWELISAQTDPAQQYEMGADPVTGKQPTGEYNTPDGEPSLDTNNAPVPADANTVTPNQEAYDIIDQSDWLTEDQKALFKQVVDGWNPEAQADTQNILNAFKKISSETIDPYFKSLADQYTFDVQKSLDFQVQQREMQQELEKTQAGQSIRQAREGLEKAGMTFTGKAVEDLGAASAYAQTTQPSVAMPTQTPVEGEYFYEGTVNQANRLMSTSSQAAYLKNLQALQSTAEQQLGSGAAALLNIPGAELVGGVTGSIEQQKKQAQADALSQLASQQGQNTAYQNPIKFNF